MTLNIISQNEKDKIERAKYKRKYYLKNKDRILKECQDYRRSRKGLISRMISHQRDGSKKRGHVAPNYTTEELQEWVFSQPNFDQLYSNWVGSGFEKSLVPSCDRLDDYKPYTLDNIQLVTWAENKAKGWADRKNGVNNKKSKAVIQITCEGIAFCEYHSTIEASRRTGIHRGNIGNCCNGGRKTAGGFLWGFA